MKNNIIKTCSTCGYKNGNKCMVSGYNIFAERQCPSVCGVNFERWQLKLGLIEKFKLWLLGGNKNKKYETNRKM